VAAAQRITDGVEAASETHRATEGRPAVTESLTRQGRKQWKAELDCHGVIRAEWAEKFATGAICISWDRYATCLDEFDRSDLWSSELRLIWDAAYALAEVGTPVNAVTIAEQMTSDGTLDVLPGGVHYLLELLDQIEDAHDPFHFEEWLRIIARQASLRRFMDGAHDILKAAETYRDLESMPSGPKWTRSRPVIRKPYSRPFPRSTS
jgi:hypothetical protein